MKVVLCGYNWAGCKALDLLLENNCEVFVYTHDSPYYVNSLKNYCLKKNIPFTVEKISVSNLSFKPDVICSIFYRYIICQKVIDFCEGKIFNLHPSLLPEYRGCSSLTWAMIEGKDYVGYSYHYLTKEVDMGDILFQEKIKLEEFDTQMSIYYRVMFQAIENFYSVVLKVSNNESGVPQKKEGVHFKRGAPFNGTIDASWEVDKVERFIRAMIFPPLPMATFKNNEIDSIYKYISVKSNNREG